jgi:polyisoprenoid-binding protein YceI
LLTAQPEYEFTDFVPTSISELPSQVELGQTITIQVTGDLTLRGMTRSVTFNVNLTVIDVDELQGSATTTVNRSNFGILNDADNGFDYHGVEEKVTLEFDFVARSVSE